MHQKHNQFSQTTEVKQITVRDRLETNFIFICTWKGRQCKINSNMLTDTRLSHRLQHGMQYT